MRPLRFARAASLALSASVGCASNHHVSPFPPADAVGPLAAPPDLEEQLRRIDDETQHAGLTLAIEQRGKLRGGGQVVVRGYDGHDPLGRAVHAVRVATPSGVVLALGPPDVRDATATASELVPSLARGGWSSGTDLNGDLRPDVVVRDAAGVLSVWSIDEQGAAPIPTVLAFPPTRALDVDGDGRPDLAGSADASDVIAPALVDAATYDAGRYTDASAGARAWHGRERDLAEQREAAALEGKRAIEACRAALERAFHAELAGDPQAEALARADRIASRFAPLADGVGQAWVRWRGVVDRAGRRE